VDQAEDAAWPPVSPGFSSVSRRLANRSDGGRIMAAIISIGIYRLTPREVVLRNVASEAPHHWRSADIRWKFSRVVGAASMAFGVIRLRLPVAGPFPTMPAWKDSRDFLASIATRARAK